ncbi:MAG TPA: response regulator transcription factor [Acidimicrobiales bacterium]|nr:response regulator transcription factor [Acidimicrobiales bacterium]
MTIHVVIVDDQALVRAGFEVLVNSAEDLEVVGLASNGDEAVRLVATLRPDVVLMDVRMPVMDGLEATRLISESPSGRSTRVLMLTTFDLDEYVYEALRSGASGFLLKDTPPEELLNAIRVIAAGEALLAPSVTKRLIAEFASRPSITPVTTRQLDTLTEREREVMVSIAQGHSNAEIAELLHMSVATVKTHVSRVLSKLDARDRTQLVVMAYQTGLVQLN